jgi:hypothetical protein
MAIVGYVASGIIRHANAAKLVLGGGDRAQG